MPQDKYNVLSTKVEETAFNIPAMIEEIGPPITFSDQAANRQLDASKYQSV